MGGGGGGKQAKISSVNKYSYLSCLFDPGIAALNRYRYCVEYLLRSEGD